METPKEKHLQSRVKSALRSAEILKWDENNHRIIDLSRLMTIPEDELRRKRNVGNGIIEEIHKLKEVLRWL